MNDVRMILDGRLVWCYKALENEVGENDGNWY